LTNYSITLLYILPQFCQTQKTDILCQKVLKIHANINVAIYVLNLRNSPEFPCRTRNWGPGTQSWCQISHQK